MATTNPEGTFYVLGQAPVDDDMAFGELLADHGVLILPGTVVEAPGWFRISPDRVRRDGGPGPSRLRVGASGGR